MRDMIAEGQAWLNEQFEANAALILTYRRGGSGGQSLQIPMTIGGEKNPLFSILGSTPGAIDFLLANPQNAIRSFSFDCLKLDFGSGPVTPQESGDQVLETINGIICVFNVMPPMTGLLAWDYQQQHRGAGARFIVHTQLTGTE